MNLNAIIGTVVGIAVVGGAAWYLSANPSVAPSEAPATEEAAGAGTFAELMARTGSWSCTVTSNVEEAPSEGTTYIADGRIRADFVARPVALGGREVVTHMIQTDGYVYTWSDMAAQGMKLAVSAGTAAAASASAVAADARVDYSCAPWAVDESKFTVPAEISFMELPEMPTFPAGQMPQ